jgi:hypothetical protein
VVPAAGVASAATAAATTAAGLLLLLFVPHHDASVMLSINLRVHVLQGKGGAQGVAGAGADGTGRI